MKLGFRKYDRLTDVSRSISDENSVHGVSLEGIQTEASLCREEVDLRKRLESKLNKPFPRTGVLPGASVDKLPRYRSEINRRQIS